MYGLKHASAISYNQLISQMDPHVYYPVTFTTGLWDHKTRRTIFFLCVDDFGIKSSKKYGADHILEYLKKHHVILTDC